MLLKSGDIIHTFVQEINPPKNKYLLCVHPDKQLFLPINTENRLIYRCISIKSLDYSFLRERDRFISTSNFIVLSKESLKKCKILDRLNKKNV